MTKPLPIRVAVVGTGFIGPVHVEALRRAGVEVIGLLGSTPAKTQAAAQRLGVEKGYATYDQLLADADASAVHITAPNRFHFEMVAAALRAGKHVMCEKPLAMDSGQSAELVRLAAAASVAAGVNYNIRYYPLCLEAAERVRGGRLGQVYHVTGSYVQDWLLYETDFNWRVLAEDGGRLRAVADIGTHWLDLIYAITGLEVEAVCADLRTVHATRERPAGSVETFSGKSSQETQPVAIETDDYACVMLRFRGGAGGCLFVSQVTAGRKNCLRFEIAAAHQALAWDSQQPNSLWIGYRHEPNQSLIRDPALLGPRAQSHAEYPGGHNEGFADTFKQCFRDFYGYIRAGDFAAAPTFPTLADGHREIVLCEAILRSHSERGWVSVPPSEVLPAGNSC